MELHTLQSGRKPRVVTAMTMLKQMLFRCVIHSDWTIDRGLSKSYTNADIKGRLEQLLFLEVSMLLALTSSRSTPTARRTSCHMSPWAPEAWPPWPSLRAAGRRTWRYGIAPTSFLLFTYALTLSAKKPLRSSKPQLPLVSSTISAQVLTSTHASSLSIIPRCCATLRCPTNVSRKSVITNSGGEQRHGRRRMSASLLCMSRRRQLAAMKWIPHRLNLISLVVW
jgi:hypothetical protein